MAASGEKVRVMHLEGGKYYKYPITSWAIGRIRFEGRLNSQYTGYLFQSKNNSSPTGNQVKWLYSGMTVCYRTDQSYVYAYPTAYTFDLSDFHAYYGYENLGGSRSYFYVDGTDVRNLSIANDCDHTSGHAYQHYLFSGGINMDVKRIRVYDMNGTLKYDWDFENGDSIPAGWTNATIKEVNI